MGCFSFERRFMTMLSRRDMIEKLAAGTAGAAVAWVAASSRAGATVGQSPAPLWDADATVSKALGAAGEATEAAKVGGEGSNESAPPAPQPPWELLHPLAVGSVLAHGWRVADLSGPVHGACVLTLRNPRGAVHRLHLCRNQGRPQGLVYTKQIDLVVMNGGEGGLNTDEGLAQAVAEVAHVLAANEGSWRHATVIDGLLPHAERLRRFSAESEWALR
jgi:hypothetical protein